MEADGGQLGLPTGAHHGGAIDPLEPDAAEAAGARVVGEPPQRHLHAGILGGEEHLQRARAALEVEHRL